MKKTTYESKLMGLLEPDQLGEKKARIHSRVLTIENFINIKLLILISKYLISNIRYLDITIISNINYHYQTTKK